MYSNWASDQRRGRIELSDENNHPYEEATMRTCSSISLIGTLLPTLLISALLLVSIRAAHAVTVTPVEDTETLLKNPAMGWVLYLDLGGISGEISDWSQAYQRWTQFKTNNDGKALAASSILYVRVPWSLMEPTEGHYAWSENASYQQLVWEAQDLKLKLAFRITVDSQDTYLQATPQFVFAAGALGYSPAGSSSKTTPYVTDPIFRTKLENFISAFAQQYDDPAVVDYIDAQGLGWWGEMGRFDDLDLTTPASRKDTFEWIVNLYASKFKHVLLGGQYGSKVFEYSLQDWALNNVGYMIRRDSYGSLVYFSQQDKDKIKANFPSVPVFAENCYQISWADSCDKAINNGLDTVVNRVIQDAKETHANTLDLRNPADASVWVTQYPELVQDFAVHGGYRFVPVQFSFPTNVTSEGEYTLGHIWKNTGVGKLPNDLPNWNYKYKVAFALLEQNTGQPVYVLIDPAEPADWLQGRNFTYSTPVKFVGVPSGTYDFAVALVNRDNAALPKIKLAITNPTSNDSWYKLGTIAVTGSSASTQVQTAALAFTPQLPGNGYISIQRIADGNNASIWTSSSTQVTFPQTIELHWGGKSVITNRISLSTPYGQSQGITLVDVEYFDGKRWKPIVEKRSISWATNTSTTETQDIPFGLYVSTKALRLKVHTANRHPTAGYYALSELRVWGALSNDTVTSTNIAAYNAIASTTPPTLDAYGTSQALIDNSDASGWSSTQGVTFDPPQYLTLDFGSQTFHADKLSLFTHYGMGQGITLLDVEYWNNGRWNTAASNVPLTWDSNTSTVERRDIPLPMIAGSALRLKVRDANLQWGNFAVNEIQLWGSGSMTGQTNVAKYAVANSTFPEKYLSYNINNINDQQDDTFWLSANGVSLPNDNITLTLDFGTRMVTTGRLALVTSYGMARGFTDVDVQYYDSSDPSLGWVQARNASIEWKTSTSAPEQQNITFNAITTNRIRLKVNNSNLLWTNTALNELKVIGWIR